MAGGMIDLARGEADDGLNNSLVGDKTIAPFSMVNFYKKQATGISLRSSNELLQTFTLQDGEEVNTSFECFNNNTIYYVTTMKSTKASRIWKYHVDTKVLEGPLAAPSILFTPFAQFCTVIFDVAGQNKYGKPPTLTINGVTVLVAGFDKLYLLDDDFTFKIFSIAIEGTVETTPIPPEVTNPTFNNIYYPRDVLLAQGRLIILGNPGPTNQVPLPGPTGFLASKIDFYFWFLKNYEEKTSAISVSINFDTFYTINEFYKRLVITTSTCILAIYGTGDEELLIKGNIRTHILGTSAGTGAEPIVMGSAMIYPTISSFRMQYMQIIATTVDKDVPDQQAPVLTNDIPSFLVFDQTRNLFYGWCGDRVRAYWWQPVQEGQILASSTYFYSDFFLMCTYSPVSKTIVFNERNTNTYYICKENEKLGVGRDVTSTWVSQVSIVITDPINRTIYIGRDQATNLPSDVVGLWINPNDTNYWNYFIRTGFNTTEYRCSNSVDTFIGYSGVCRCVIVSSNINTTLPAFYQNKPYSIALNTDINLYDSINQKSVSTAETKVFLGKAPFYLEILDKTARYEGTMTQSLAFHLNYPTISWYATSSYYGSAVALYTILLTTSWFIRENFKVTLNNSAARTIEGNKGYTYATFRFKRTAKLGDNEMTIEIKPINGNFNASDCLIKQLLLT